MMALRLVVFDMAGTTVDDPGIVNRGLCDALAAAGLNVPPGAVNALMGLPKPEAIRRLIEASDRREALRDRIEAIHRDFVERMVAHYATDPSVAEVPGIDALFRTLQGDGVKVALDTGFDRNIAQVIIDRLGWAERLDASVTSDEVPRGRPHPEMIRHLMARLGVDDPRTVAKVGDAPADLEEGTNAGCGRVIGVTWGTHSRAQLAGSPHTHLVDSVEDLLRALREPSR
jgi:phosphonatase-like hydrolase